MGLNLLILVETKFIVTPKNIFLFDKYFRKSNVRHKVDIMAFLIGIDGFSNSEYFAFL